ncbi:aminoglycoside adenylyltransferase domain-containing protein [Tissierella carlieri]|uniref:aminoglycoside adenylyltransferase domain-containing protein n=1 Tax=Tissierella carlieri TaxID=689904 RepID=UPI00386ED2D0
MEPKKILDIIVQRYKNILDKNLVGIYLHGSLAMGCYTNESDIDFLVVVREAIDVATKKDIIESIIHLDNLPKKGIEMSIVLEKYAKEFIYPTPFELHYSDSHREKYLSDNNYICGNSTDEDLAAHFTIVINRGICLYGKKIGEVFADVPRKYYIDSIVNDIENAGKSIVENTVYITLNLCRVLYYMKENVVCSKLEAGNWAKEVVPQKYRRIVEDATNVYTNKLDQMEYSKGILKEYANYMLKEIKVYK